MSKSKFAFNIIFFISIGLISFSAIRSESPHSDSSLKSTGGPIYNTNAPADKTCSGAEGTSPCHSGGIPDNTGPATSSITSSGGTMYVPGQTYTITPSITHQTRTRFGFQLSVRQLSNNSNAGSITITDPTNTWLHPVSYGSCLTCEFVCHKLAGTYFATTTGQWSFTWTAPSTNVGNIRLYACFNASNNNNNETGEETYFTTLTLTPSSTAITEQDLFSDITIFPSPSTDGKFSINSSFHKIDKVEVYDIRGNLVLLNTLNTRKTLDLNEPSGVYFVSFFIGDMKTRRKVVITR